MRAGGLRLLGIVTIAVALGGCASTSGSTPAAASRPAATSAARAVRCTAPRQHGWRTVAVGGVRRQYLLTAPAAHGLRPLVLLFHGYEEKAGWINAYTGFSRQAARRGFVTAVPQGNDDRWNFPRSRAIGPNDVRFVARIIRRLETQACVDPSRVFVTGFSDGADMANELACADHQQVAATAGVAASVVPRGCRSPTRVLEIHGTADPVVPYAGGGGQRPPPFQNATPVSVRRQMAAWVQLDGCSSEPTRQRLSASVRAVRYPGCSPGGQVELLVVRGGGHTWPGAAVDLPYGVTDRSISATEQILTFFSRA